MTYHLPQHLLFGLVSIPLTHSHPLYYQYNLTLRNEYISHHSPASSIIHHRLLQFKDFEFEFDITTTECVSPLIEWSMSQIREMGYVTYKELYDSRILDMPYIYKHYIDKNEGDESFGYDGSQTEELVQRHKDTMTFWTEADVDNSITTDGVLLLSMHGSDLMDNEKLVPTIIHMFDFDNENDILQFAEKVQEYVMALPGKYDNPLLTMNAVATRGGRGSRTGKSIASLIIGDGVLEFVKDINLSPTGPDFIHAHEFAHHLQYEMDMEHGVPPGYENDIRRKELMADAISAYFLAHDRGGNMDAHEISEFSMAAFATGDCNTGQDDHHGSPKQRYCAAVWGASRAVLAPNGSPLIDPEAFVQMFNTDYHGIIVLDDVICTLYLEDPDDEDSTTVDEPAHSVQTSYLDTNIPESVEVTFSNQEEYETTDGTHVQPESAHSGSGYGTTHEPPHETIYKPHAPHQSTNIIGTSESGAEQPGPEEFAHETIWKPPQTPAIEEEHMPTNEGIILVAGNPVTEKELDQLTGEDTIHSCDLPWVYCQISYSGSTSSKSTYAAVTIALSFALI
eukprot:scaffold9907_cov75-Cyclotella_meneghiniana.AAC.2